MRIPLWGVVTPTGEPLVGTLHHTRDGAAYRFGATRRIPSAEREGFWLTQQALGYRLHPFTLSKEAIHG